MAQQRVVGPRRRSLYCCGMVVADRAWQHAFSAFEDNSFLRGRFLEHLMEINKASVGFEFRGGVTLETSLQQLQQPPSGLNVRTIGIVLVEFIWPPHRSGVDIHLWLENRIRELLCWSWATVLFLARAEEVDSLSYRLQPSTVGHRRLQLKDVTLHYTPQGFDGAPVTMTKRGARAIVLMPSGDTEWKPSCLAGREPLHVPAAVLEAAECGFRTLQLAAYTLDSAVSICRYIRAHRSEDQLVWP